MDLPGVVDVALVVLVVVGHDLDGLDGLGGTLAVRICFLLVLRVLLNDQEPL